MVAPAILILSALLGHVSIPSDVTIGQPFQLLCDLLPSPVLGVDTDPPVFSWALRSSGRNVVSTAHQIRLSSLDPGHDRPNRPTTAAAAAAPAAAPAGGVAAPVWDSGKVASAASVQVPYGGPKLAPGAAFSWQVRWWSNATDPAEPSAWSAPATLVTGLLADADWMGAAFLSCDPATIPAPTPPPRPPKGQPFWPVTAPPRCRLLRTGFAVPGKVRRATAFVAALGYQELRLNGAKASGDAVLEPGWTQYDIRLLYSSYDVTPFVKQGQNVVGVVLGGGWPGHLGHAPGVKLVLKLVMEDGSVRHVVSAPAGGWVGTTAGPWVLDDIYGGETYNATLEIPGWDAPVVENEEVETDPAAVWRAAAELQDPSIAAAVLSSQMMQPIRATTLLPAVTKTEPAQGVQVYDFGQNIAGWGKISLTSCPRGSTVKLSFSELLHRADHASPVCSGPATSESGTSSLLDPLHNCTWTKGMVNMQMLMAVPHHGSTTGDRCAVDLYICAGAKHEEWEPRFTYHGFRYAQVEGLPPGTALTIAARVVHSDVESSSVLRFEEGTAAPLLNQLQSNIEWTQRDNLHSVPTDCDQRTERQGWMADASVSAEQAYHNFAMGPFYRNWFQSMVDVQSDFPAKDPLDHRACRSQGRLDCLGAVTDTVPHPPGTFGARPADPSWSAAFDLVYWYNLRYSGDRRSAAKHYPALKLYVDYMLTIAANDTTGLLQWHTTGDWLEPGQDRFPGGRTNSHVAVRDRMTSAFSTIMAIKILRDAAIVLGTAADAKKYSTIVDDQLVKWHTVFYNTTDAPTEAHGRFVAPVGRGATCPVAGYPGGCTWWESFDSKTLHFVSNCGAFPATCHAAQHGCWPDFTQGLQIHYTNDSSVWSLNVGRNYTCADPRTPNTTTPSEPTYGDGSQVCLGYTMYLGVPPTSALLATTLGQLVARVATDGNHPTTGIIATKWMPEALGKHGRPDVVLDMVLQPGFPGWMDQIAQNATTIWENWVYLDGPGMNSHNHPALTSIGAWLYRYLAGVRIPEDATEPGFGTGHGMVTLAPYPNLVADHDRVKALSVSLSSQHGNVSMAWRFDSGRGGGLALNITLPPNTAGRVQLPKGAWGSIVEGGVAIWEHGGDPQSSRMVPGVTPVDNGNAGETPPDYMIGGGLYQFVATLR